MKRKVIDYGEYVEYKIYEKDINENAIIYAQQTKKDIENTFGKTPRKIYDYESSIYKEARLLFGDCVKYDTEDERFKQSIYRTKKTFENILKCNVNLGLASFVTLTYGDTTLSRKKALKDFVLFKKRLLDNDDVKLKYVGVLERQKERGKKENNYGSWHFHLIVFEHKKEFNYQYIKKRWGLGIVNVKFIKNKDQLSYIGKMSNYLTKYLSKDRILAYEKTYFTSHNLNKPVKLSVSDFIKDIYNTSKYQLKETTSVKYSYVGSVYTQVYKKIS